jgi:hypothetical protein
MVAIVYRKIVAELLGRNLLLNSSLISLERRMWDSSYRFIIVRANCENLIIFPLFFASG